MPVPDSVDFPIAFSAVRQNGRKEEIHICETSVDVELAEIASTDTAEVLRITHRHSRHLIRVDSENKFFWHLGDAPKAGYCFEARRMSDIARPTPGNVELRDLKAHFPSARHKELKSAHGSQTQAKPFDPDSFKAFDMSTIDGQTEDRLKAIRDYVVIGAELYLRVEEPAIRMTSDGRIFYWLAHTWQTAYPYSCYSFAEFDQSISMARSLNRKFDQAGFRASIERQGADHFTPSFVDRRIALLPLWFIKRLPQFLQDADPLEAARFITSLPGADRELLSAIVAAAQSVTSGLISEGIHQTAERLLNLNEGSMLHSALTYFEDAQPMISVLRSEWENRPVPVDFGFAP